MITTTRPRWAYQIPAAAIRPGQILHPPLPVQHPAVVLEVTLTAQETRILLADLADLKAWHYATAQPTRAPQVPTTPVLLGRDARACLVTFLSEDPERGGLDPATGRCMLCEARTCLTRCTRLWEHDTLQTDTPTLAARLGLA